MCKVSVVVPVYKVEKYLGNCIESLIGQSLRDIEIILVDDGSPDNCPTICDKYAEKDNRIKVIHKDNAGVSAARNDGFAIAKGEWVIFCDSDDWMESNACEVLYVAGTENDADVVIADINRITEKRTERKHLFANSFSYTEEEDKKQLVISTLYPECCKEARSTMGFGGPWNKLIRRNFLLENNIRFNMDVAGVCDDRLHIALAYVLARKVIYIQVPVYNYVLVENSITRSYKEKVRDINMEIFKAYSSLLNTAYGAPEGKEDLCYVGGVQRYRTHIIPSLYGA